MPESVEFWGGAFFALLAAGGIIGWLVTIWERRNG